MNNSGPTDSHNRGFTLIELMITLAVGSILLGISIPSFTHAVHKHQSKSAAHHLLSAYQFSRYEAVKRGKTLTVCGTDDGITCSRIWHNDLVVFWDKNSNNTIEPNERIRRFSFNHHKGFIKTRISLRQTYIHLRPDGSNKQFGSFIYCNPASRATTRQVVFNRIGRPRISKITLQNNLLKNSKGQILECG